MLRAAACSVVAAFLALGAAIVMRPEGLSRNASFEVLFWGFGHVLQLAFVLWMLAAWCALVRDEAGRPAFPRWLVSIALWLGYALLGVAAWIVASAAYRESFTRLMAWGSWLAPAAFLLHAAFTLGTRRRPALRAGAEFFVWSALLFAAGCVAGVFIRGESTLVPAHYHGTIGAVTLALMAWSAGLLSGEGREPRGAAFRLALRAYAAGLALLIAGFAWLGHDGAPRKALAGVFDADPGALLALAKPRDAWRSAPEVALRRDARPRAVAIAVLAVGLGGGALSWLNADPAARRRSEPAPARIDARVDPEGHARSMQRLEFDARFRQAVIMLHARQYEHAATALHRLMKIVPEVPEAHVNMGFAMLGLQRFDVALWFFTSATELRPAQANAYYGMAVALEARGDLPAALGAMRTFVHLTTPDDPYLPKARAALWEWQEAQLASKTRR